MNAAALLLTLLPSADPMWPLTPEVPAAARPTFYPGQVFDLSPDGKTALSTFHLGYYQQYLRLWDIETGAVVDDLHLGTADGVTSARYSPDGKTIAVGLGPHGAPHHVRLLDVRGGWSVREFWGFESGAMVRGFSPDGTKLFTLDYPAPGSRKSFKPRLDTWDVATGKRLDTKEAEHEDRLTATTPDGKAKLSRAEDGSFVVTRAGGQSVTLAVGKQGFNYFAALLSPDGKRAVISTHAWGYVLDATTGALLRTLRTDSQIVASAAPADGGKLLFVGVTTGKYVDQRLGKESAAVCVWDTAKPELRSVIPVPMSDLYRLQPSADGKRFTVIGGDRWRTHKIEVWDTEAKKRLREFDVPKAEGHAVVSPDGNWVAHASWGKETQGVWVWNTETGKLAEEVSKAAKPTGALAFTPDSKRLATVTTAEYAEWDVATGKKEASWKQAGAEGDGLRGGRFGADGIYSGAVVPGGKGVFTVSPTAKRRQSYLLGLATEKKLWHLGEVWDHASHPAVSPDGRWLAVTAGSGNERHQVYLLRLNEDGTPELRDRVEGERNFAPWGGGDEKKVVAWRAWAVDEYTGVIAFSPDGNRLYTGGGSHTLRAWDVESRELKATLYAVPPAKPDDSPADWVAFTPAGHFAASPGGEQVLRFRDATVETWFGLRRPVPPVPAAVLPQLCDPAKVAAALGK